MAFGLGAEGGAFGGANLPSFEPGLGGKGAVAGRGTFLGRDGEAPLAALFPRNFGVKEECAGLTWNGTATM